ncbi:cullin-1-like [Cryptomeria japonica]|uniref:cullin-1-like n=1 Tax=Cryptomeria japonica TaxID=3369 RepID=UPI0027DA5876|nr:cullin-1-like [Cryptomeria japonica]
MEMEELDPLQIVIAKVKQIVEGKVPFGPNEYLEIYYQIYIKFNKVSSPTMQSEYKKALKDHINSTVVPALMEKKDEFLLTEIVKQWEYYKEMVSILSKIVSLRFNRLYSSLLSKSEEAARRCFPETVYNEVLCSNVQGTMMVRINKMREGESVLDGTVLKNVVCMMWDFGLDYYKDFEVSVFENTNIYYSSKTASWICDYSSPDYLVKVLRYLRLEKETIAMHCVHQSSQTMYLEMVENELLCKHECQLLREDSDCHPLLKNEKMDDLSKMFNLFSGIDKGIQLMAKIFRQHVTRHGTSLVKHGGQMVAEALKANNGKEVIASVEDQFVRSVIQLNEKYLQCVEERFMNHCLFKNALMAAFQSFCNQQVAGNNIWELLVTFCDNILTNRNMRYSNVEDALEKVSKIFPCVYDKDMVADFYRKKLADRLLSHRSSSADYEITMLVKLKFECGRQFTSKLEGMLTDWTLAMKTQSDFEEYLSQNPVHPRSGIEFSVTTLTSGFWPSYKSPDSLVLPVEMVRHLQSFKEFYNREKMNRRLTWKYSLGICIIIGRFDQGEIQIAGTPCHASALLLFNETERLSFLQVKSQLNLGVEDTIALLKSLACSKYKILNKLPDTQSVMETDCFEFNAKFSCNKRKIRLPAPTAKLKENVGTCVFQDRHHIIDASIVRIMKRRETVAHRELVMECNGQVKDMFKPDMKEVKKRIENLIDREYLERDKENPDMYNYLP